MTDLKDIIEDHRQKSGATKVHFTWGSNGPPRTEDQLKEFSSILEKLREEQDLFTSFEDVERKEAEIQRLRTVISRIHSAIGRGDIEEARHLSDWVVDADLPADITWMTDERRKKGRELPPGAAEYVTRVTNKFPDLRAKHSRLRSA